MVDFTEFTPKTKCKIAQQTVSRWDGEDLFELVEDLYWEIEKLSVEKIRCLNDFNDAVDITIHGHEEL